MLVCWTCHSLQSPPDLSPYLIRQSNVWRSSVLLEFLRFHQADYCFSLCWVVCLLNTLEPDIVVCAQVWNIHSSRGKTIKLFLFPVHTSSFLCFRYSPSVVLTNPHTAVHSHPPHGAAVKRLIESYGGNRNGWLGLKNTDPEGLLG